MIFDELIGIILLDLYSVRGDTMERVPLRERVDLILEKYGSDPFRRAKELKKLLKEAEKEPDVYSIGKINLFLSICIFQQGRRDSILSYAYKAVSILVNLDDYYPG